MIKLCGFSASNYYNKVKFVLLEKGIPFEEVHVLFSPPDELLGRSPLGKIPFIETDEGVLTESQVIVDYLEAAYPQTLERLEAFGVSTRIASFVLPAAR